MPARIGLIIVMGVVVMHGLLAAACRPTPHPVDGNGVMLEWRVRAAEKKAALMEELLDRCLDEKAGLEVEYNKLWKAP